MDMITHQAVSIYCITACFFNCVHSRGMVLGKELSNITCPVLGLMSDAEGPILLSQAREFIEKVGSADKTLTVLSLALDEMITASLITLHAPDK